MKSKRLFLSLAVLLFLCGLASSSLLRPASANSAISTSFPSPSLADPESKYRVVRAYYQDRQMVNDLASWLEPWEVHHDQGYLVVGVDQQQYDLLLTLGFRLEIDQELTDLLAPFLREKGVQDLDLGYIAKCTATLKMRSKTLVEMAEAADFYLKEEVEYAPEAVNKFFSAQTIPWMEAVTESLSNLAEWNESAMESAFGRIIDRTGATMKQIAPPLRLALTGKTASPGLFEVMAAMGRERTLSRLNKALNYIKGH